MSKNIERAKEKKKKILEKTIQYFLNNDLNKVTIDEIAANANVSKMTIYKYFGDKEKLYEDISKTILDRFFLQLKHSAKSDEETSERMINTIMVMIDFIALDFAKICTEIGKINDEAQQAYDRFNLIVKDVIMDLIQKGKAEKIVKEELTNEVIYHYIDMSLSYFYHNEEYRNKILNDAVFASSYMEFIWENIFTQSDLFSVEYE